MSLSNERGSVVVLVAVMLFLIFFCVALVVDIGHIHNVKIELQRAVDAAALAGAQELPDGDVQATAVAMARANGIDKQVNNADVETEVVTGWWNSEIIKGKRFFDGGTPINAVKVTATLKVPHFFFFPAKPTTIIADAIAVAQTINPVLPFAMLSCSRSNAKDNKWRLEDMTFTDITTFVFAPQDTSAWTSLTFSPANAQKIKSLIENDVELDEFNGVLYGHNLKNDGIENTDVTPDIYPYNNTAECKPIGIDIPCGLGRINDKEIATPKEFTDHSLPPNLTNIDGDVINGYKATTFDPLTDFGSWKDSSGIRKPGALPRWYHLNNVEGLQSEDYFARILTQDGILLNSTKLQNGTYSNEDGEKPFGDNRFRSSKNVSDGGDLLTCDNKGLNCRPNYSKILQLAGYPQVYLTNGLATDVLHKFLTKIGAQDNTMACSEVDADIFPATQQALILKAPVIFVGDCDTWSPPNPSDKFFYVGLSKFLVTRLWVNTVGYGCPGSDLQPEGFSGPSRIEGLQVLPVADGEDDHASLIQIYLVE